jgi:hypothetical protein
MWKIRISLAVWNLSNPYEDVSLPYNNGTEISGKRLATAILSALQRSLEMTRPTGEAEKEEDADGDVVIVVGSTSKQVRLVIDSMTHTQLLLGERTLIEFVMDLTRKVINLISNKYRIKHGQKIKLYSAYSNDFGNPQIPAKVLSNE